MRHKFAAALLAIYIGTACAADDLAVEVKREGANFIVGATATVAAPAPLVWEVLTDYDHLARFIPGLSRSGADSRCQPCGARTKGRGALFVFRLSD